MKPWSDMVDAGEGIDMDMRGMKMQGWIASHPAHFEWALLNRRYTLRHSHGKTYETRGRAEIAMKRFAKKFGIEISRIRYHEYGKGD